MAMRELVATGKTLPWRRPRTFCRKYPLHFNAEVDAALGQRKRQQLIAHPTFTF
jgi:hypothetical protein